MERTDRELLAEYAGRGSQEAFAELARRHAGQVLAACRRILDDAHEAEDAAQAVFLLLARRARRLSPATLVAGWLQRTARYVALNARTVRLRRQRREREGGEMRQGRAREAQAAATGADLRPLLDEALAALPRAQREAVLLCGLYGRGQEEAARELGCGRSALSMRLQRGLERLRARLERAGLALPAALLAALLAEAAAAAAATPVPASFPAACLGTAAASAGAREMMEEAMKAMFWGRIKAAAGGLAAAAAVAAVSVALWPAGRAGEGRPENQGQQAASQAASATPAGGAAAAPRPGATVPAAPGAAGLLPPGTQVVDLEELWSRPESAFEVPDPENTRARIGGFPEDEDPVDELVALDARGNLYLAGKAGAGVLALDPATGRRASFPTFSPWGNTRVRAAPGGMLVGDNLSWFNDREQVEVANSLQFFPPGAGRPAWRVGTGSTCYYFTGDGERVYLADWAGTVYCANLADGRLLWSAGLAGLRPAAGDAISGSLRPSGIRVARGLFLVAAETAGDASVNPPLPGQIALFCFAAAGGSAPELRWCRTAAPAGPAGAGPSAICLVGGAQGAPGRVCLATGAETVVIEAATGAIAGRVPAEGGGELRLAGPPAGEPAAGGDCLLELAGGELRRLDPATREARWSAAEEATEVAGGARLVDCTLAGGCLVTLTRRQQELIDLAEPLPGELEPGEWSHLRLRDPADGRLLAEKRYPQPFVRAYPAGAILVVRVADGAVTGYRLAPQAGEPAGPEI